MGELHGGRRGRRGISPNLRKGGGAVADTISARIRAGASIFSGYTDLEAAYRVAEPPLAPRPPKSPLAAAENLLVPGPLGKFSADARGSAARSRQS